MNRSPIATRRRTVSHLLASLSCLAALIVVGCSPGAIDSATTEDPANDDTATSDTATFDTATFDEGSYLEEFEAWHRKRDERLQAEGGWLSVAGLYWLADGENRFGTALDNDVVFPPATAPAHAGTFLLADGVVTVRAESGAAITRDGEPVTELALDTDAKGEPTELRLGNLTFYPIKRVDRMGIRLKDSERAERKNFRGNELYPVDLAWRVEARFEPYPEPKAIKIPNILGTEFDATAPGMLFFEVAGESFQLEPTGEPEEGLFVVFGDATNGLETYGGGRFLAVDAPVDGKVILDFNRAYNPPCVFTPFATCPLPTREAKLAIEVRAGEKMYGYAHH